MTAAVPVALEARQPPESRGVAREHVRMMVTRRGAGAIEHARFAALPEFLEPGDLLVVNNSRTLPAALPARLGELPVELRLSSQLDDGDWVVELRGRDLSPLAAPPPGVRIELPAGAHALVRSPVEGSARLAVARLAVAGTLDAYLTRHGRPIRYPYVDRDWPLDAYQTVFALESGSAEMPSAGRPFTAELVVRLVAHGVHVAPVTLHAGVSSPERGEPPQPERFRVPAATARLVNHVRAGAGRVIAVGTTVVRSLETVSAPDGTVAPGEGRTSLVIGPGRGLRAVDGVLTGWHEPASSHLDLLSAAAGPELLDRAYTAARAEGYRWHEFGDTQLILP